MTKKSGHRQFLSDFRERHLDDLEAIYQSQLAIVQSERAEDKDKVNASKNCIAILGIAKAAPEKSPEPPPPPPSKKDHTKPELSPELKDRLKNILNAPPA